jgi:two-component system sensor histidine kinase HydH
LTPLPPAPVNWSLWTQATILLLSILVLGGIAVAVIFRRLLRSRAKPDDWTAAKPSSDNPSAFMAASMQGVIQKLREQEKELARLHLLEKERAEETGRLSEAVTRNMPAGLLLVNATGAISSANPAAEAALGIRGLQYRSFREALGPHSALAQMLEACLRDGLTFQRDEIEHTTPSGEARQIGVTISPIRRGPREDKVSGAICLMSDLSELAALQKRMRLKESLAALGEMSAGIAHEFKNSLATISGYAQMIRSEAGAGELADCAERILQQTRSLTHVVTEFLKFAKPIELSNEIVCVRSLIERVVDEIREAVPGPSLRFEGEFADVPGDEGLLRQALLNLARNAAEAVSGNTRGQVLLGGALEEKAGRLWQRISVADNGPGVPPGDLDRLFLPFFTTKAEGTGLGLALVQKIALQHGGSVEVRNRTGGGAEFLLWLPLRQQPVPAAIASGSASI